MQDSVERIADSVRNSQMLRLLLIGILVMMLLIPAAMIGRLVSERKERRQEAVSEVSSKWGEAQTIIGPALVVPYTYRWTEAAEGGRQITRIQVVHSLPGPQ